VSNRRIKYGFYRCEIRVLQRRKALLLSRIWKLERERDEVVEEMAGFESLARERGRKHKFK